MHPVSVRTSNISFIKIHFALIQILGYILHNGHNKLNTLVHITLTHSIIIPTKIYIDVTHGNFKKIVNIKMFITTHNPTNNILIHFLDIFRRFSKLQILFICLAIVLSLSSPVSSMHHLKKLHLILTPLLLCIGQNDNQKINTNAFFFINHSLIHLTLYFGHPQNCLPPFLTVVVVLKTANSRQLQMGATKVVLLLPSWLELDCCCCTSI